MDKTYLLTVLAFFLTCKQIEAEFAVITASSSSQSKDFCATYSPDWKELPRSLSDAPSYHYKIVPGDILCGNDSSNASYDGEAVFSFHDEESCSFSQKHAFAQHHNATELVIISTNDELFTAIAVFAKDYQNSTIPIAVMKKSDFVTMKELGESAVVQLYAPTVMAVDSNLVVIWILAVGTVVIGSYWSGIVARKQREKLIEKETSSSNEKLSESDEEGPSMQITPLMVIIFVALICGFLLMVYYLYKYVIYVIIAIFAIASWNGMYECLDALVAKLPCCQFKIPPEYIPFMSKELSLKSLLVFCFSFALVIWWVIVRNASYGWVLQDILGVMFCISLLKNLRLPSMKICTLLLVLLLIYDVFFVFITPLFSASHKSVMVDVATGEGYHEQLPMVIKVPRIVRSPGLVCQKRDYSLLGFGDVLVPGLFVSFCNSFDQMAKTPYHIYFVASSIAYGLGLIITFVALYLMKEGQPALVYLVPCTLGTVFVISFIRREFCNLWNGKCYVDSNTLGNNAAVNDEEDIDCDEYEHQATSTTDNGGRDGERERLIN